MSGNAYLCQWNGSVFIQVMNCHLTDIKPLPKPMLIYYHVDHQLQHILEQFTPNTKTFFSEYAPEMMSAIMSGYECVNISVNGIYINGDPIHWLI